MAARTSFLDAINRVLQMLGEAPVNSTQGQFGLAKQAEVALNDVSRTIQTEGWSFNTDLEKKLERSARLWEQSQPGQRPIDVPHQTSINFHE